MSNCSQSESAISQGEDGAASRDAGQLDSAGQAILRLLHKASDAAEANIRQALETAQKLQANFALRKIGSPDLKPKFSSIARERSAPRSGSAKFSLRLRIALLPSRNSGDGK